MRKKRSIIIRSPRLRRVRNELRNILILWTSDVRITINQEDKEYTSEARKKLSDLSLMVELSICYCRYCGRSDQDMIYIPNMKEWICLECNSEAEHFKKLKDEIREDMTSLIISEFLDKLAEESGIGLSREGSRCNGYKLSRLILGQMGITKVVQDKFLELSHYYGGHCDCEILLNAQSKLIED